MPIPFNSSRNSETLGVVGFLKLQDEQQGGGIRAALLATSASQLLPLEFCFTRMDVSDSVLLGVGQSRRVAIVSLIEELFRSMNRVPDVILGLADEIPPLVFSEEIRTEVPVCRVSIDPAPRRGVMEEIEQLGASLFVVWSTPPLGEGAVARRLLRELAEHTDPLEPFDRVAAGIAEAYAGR